MKLSKKAEYALRAMLAMASDSSGEPVSVRRLAEEHGLPRKFLEAVMRELREAGLVRSIPGKQGGYLLEKPVGDIAVGEVFEAVGYRIGEAPEEPSDSDDPVAGLMKELGGEVGRLVKETSLRHILVGASLGRAIGWDGAYMHGDGI